jgi:hypothetical protein
VLIVLAGCQAQSTEQDVAMLKNLPPINGSSYRCGEMVHVVNHLRHLGKERALTVLRDYLASRGDHDKVHIICRLLFINPKGWEPPQLGAPQPDINEAAADEFPLFPIALSERVPFILVDGYSLEGAEELAFGCLDLCKRLEMIKEDYPTTGYELAAEALTRRGSFRQLFQKEDQPRMAAMILRQATAAKEPEQGPADE